MKRNILGPRIRERRREMGITQADLARKLEISAPYLNLIEHNKRVIGGSLLTRVAQQLQLPIEQLDGASDRRLLDALNEIGRAPDMHPLEVEIDSSGEFIGRFPGWAKAVAALARKEIQATQVSKMLADRLSHDPFISDTVHRMLTHSASLRSAAEIIEQFPDLEGDQLSRFNHIISEESRSLAEIGDALASFFDNAAMAKRNLTPLDEIDDWFDHRENYFADIESRAARLHEQMITGSKAVRYTFARNLAEDSLKDIIERVVKEEPLLETELARNRGVDILIQYARNAILVPLHLLAQQVKDLRYDVELLADVFAVDFKVICERLTALHGSHETPRFGYYQCNAAGTILRSRNLPGIGPAKYGSACPLWLLFRAQQTPMTTLRQLVQMPDGDRFVFVARASADNVPGFNQPTHFITDMLVIRHTDSLETTYAPRPDTLTEPVGVSCRACPRENCNHRASDPLSG